MPSLQSEADIGTARDELLDQLQIRRVVSIGRVLRTSAHADAAPPPSGVRPVVSSRGPAAELSSNQNTLPNPRAFRADHASHQFHQRLLMTRPDGPYPLRAPLRPRRIERLKQLRQHVRRNPRGVAQCSRDNVPAYSRRWTSRNPRRPFHSGVVFDRVGKRANENLFQPGPVALTKIRIPDGERSILIPRFRPCGTMMA